METNHNWITWIHHAYDSVRNIPQMLSEISKDEQRLDETVIIHL